MSTNTLRLKVIIGLLACAALLVAPLLWAQQKAKSVKRAQPPKFDKKDRKSVV